MGDGLDSQYVNREVDQSIRSFMQAVKEQFAADGVEVTAFTAGLPGLTGTTRASTDRRARVYRMDDQADQDILTPDLSPKAEVVQALNHGDLEQIASMVNPRYGPASRLHRVVVPLRWEAKLFGVLIVWRRRPFDKRIKAMIETSGRFLAVVLRYAQKSLMAERESNQLARIGRVLVAATTTQELFQEIYEAVASVLYVDAFFIAEYKPESSEIEFVYMVDDGEVYSPRTRTFRDGLTEQVIKSQESMILLRSEGEEIEGARKYGKEGSVTRSILIVPMVVEGEAIGAISAQTYMPGAYHEGDKQWLETIAAQAALSIQNVKLYHKARRTALTDPLTGLGNARHFYQVLEREIERAGRYDHPLSLIMFDSDSLKLINDQHGHPMGNKHLQQLAKIVENNIREVDHAFRYAGDEFMVILPETFVDEALTVAERIRAGLEGVTIGGAGGVPITVTVSAGVAAFPLHAESAEKLVQRADRALYMAKNSGRNRVIGYPLENE